MSFIGKVYKLDKQENFEEFVNSLPPIPEEYKKILFTHKPTVKVVKDGDTYTLITSKPNGGQSEVSFKIGVEFDEQVREHTAKTTFTLDGNVLTQVQKFNNGDVTFTFKREFSDSELLVTITSSVWDGVARRYYKAE